MNQHLQREKGRAARGKKVHDIRPGRKLTKRINVIGGMCGGRLIASKQYEHTTTSAFFEQWFADELLLQVPKGHTIIMDNASFHRKSTLFMMATAAGVRLLFLPPYSPDLNPIEHAWANMKRWLRHHMANFGEPSWAIHEYLWWNEYQYY